MSTPKLVNFQHFWIPGGEKNMYVYIYIYVIMYICIVHDFAIFGG